MKANFRLRLIIRYFVGQTPTNKMLDWADTEYEDLDQDHELAYMIGTSPVCTVVFNTCTLMFTSIIDCRMMIWF